MVTVKSSCLIVGIVLLTGAALYSGRYIPDGDGTQSTPTATPTAIVGVPTPFPTQMPSSPPDPHIYDLMPTGAMPEAVMTPTVPESPPPRSIDIPTGSEEGYVYTPVTPVGVWEFQFRPLLDRYPVVYCPFFLSGGAEASYATIDSPDGWSRMSDTILTDVYNACDRWWEVNVWMYKDNNRPDWCVGAAACVTWDKWEWRADIKAWSAEVCNIHVNPSWWDVATDYWKRILIAHEFGHCMGLIDVPLQGAGVTIMDYDWAETQPTTADILEANSMNLIYKMPVWLRWVIIN